MITSAIPDIVRHFCCVSCEREMHRVATSYILPAYVDVVAQVEIDIKIAARETKDIPHGDDHIQSCTLHLQLQLAAEFTDTRSRIRLKCTAVMRTYSCYLHLVRTLKNGRRHTVAVDTYANVTSPPLANVA